jgi:hypothetical protein
MAQVDAALTGMMLSFVVYLLAFHRLLRLPQRLARLARGAAAQPALGLIAGLAYWMKNG